jgi:hypothetical protein
MGMWSAAGRGSCRELVKGDTLATTKGMQVFRKWILAMGLQFRSSGS